MEGLAGLFTDSASSGKLANFSLTDFGTNLKKAKVSFGNVNLGIYKQGKRKLPKPIFHDQESEKELYNLVSQLKYKGHYYASLRNFKNSIIMNFTAEDFARGLYFSTFTFNNFQKELKFSFTLGTTKGKNCPFPNCQQPHFYQTVPIATSSFLAEKKTAKKRLDRDLEGVNDLFAYALRFIHEH
ncbi:7130_t:CDS:1 [Ambispora gerdemannii]|uniref:7130_t:CDS:1 n=1 Tax=Ambispora gerdemannii TaxID=144530 RepID=A0A9N8ZYM2_9GLOM|nr:7130_t:CDS:1 [Ambispora gerdemannii]